MSKEAAAEDELACLQREARETAAAMLVADRFASLIQAVSVACAKLAVRSTFSKERLLDGVLTDLRRETGVQSMAGWESSHSRPDAVTLLRGGSA